MRKMVFLTLRAEQNGQTFSFVSPLKNVSKVRLISCVIPNSWNTIKENATMKYETNSLNSANSFVNGANVLEPGYYSPSCFVAAIKHLFAGIGETASVQYNSHHGEIMIGQTTKFPQFSPNMAEILGFSRMTTVGRAKLLCLNLKREYFVHCSLIDRDSNLFNGELSDILSCFHISGKAFEFVKYADSGEIPFRNCLKRNEVSTIQISVKDFEGNVFDFQECPLVFELEIL